MATSSDYRLGEFDFPRGWFMVGESSDATSTPGAIRYFGRDLVVYRGESGQVYVTEAYCPHMGAHLARNKTSYIVHDGQQVRGETISCPFHGWQFGPDGACTNIPYSNSVPKAAKLKTFPVIEQAGTIWIWHDPEGLEPDYDLPDFGPKYGAPGWVEWKIDHMGDLDIHPIEVVDNMADYYHFVTIHGANNFVYFANEFQGNIVHQYYASGHRTLTLDPKDVLSVDTWYVGPSFSQSEMAGTFNSFIMVAHTPIDDGTIRIWHGLMVQVNDGSAPITEALRAAALQYQEGSRLAVAQDVEIWQNKAPAINPMVVPGDGPFGMVRRWYRQFYNRRAAVPGLQEKSDGVHVTLDRRASAAAELIKS